MNPQEQKRAPNQSGVGAQNPNSPGTQKATDRDDKDLKNKDTEFKSGSKSDDDCSTSKGGSCNTK